MNYYRGHIDISIKAESEDRAQWIMHEIGCLVNSEQPGTHSLTAEQISHYDIFAADAAN
jgi:hypothetical protein